jgi:mRNA interferase MazF
MKSKKPGPIASEFPRRGEIWWAALDPVQGSEIAKTRPCVVLGRDVVNQLRRTVVVVPLSSSSVANPPIQVAVRCGGKSVVAVIDQVRAISKQRLIRREGSLTATEMQAIGHALQRVLDLA